MFNTAKRIRLVTAFPTQHDVIKQTHIVIILHLLTKQASLICYRNCYPLAHNETKRDHIERAEEQRFKPDFPAQPHATNRGHTNKTGL